MSQPEQRLRLTDGRVEVSVPQGVIEIYIERDPQGRAVTQVNMYCNGHSVVNPDPTRATGGLLCAYMRERAVHIIPLEDERALDRRAFG